MYFQQKYRALVEIVLYTTNIKLKTEHRYNWYSNVGDYARRKIFLQTLTNPFYEAAIAIELQNIRTALYIFFNKNKIHMVLELMIRDKINSLFNNSSTIFETLNFFSKHSSQNYKMWDLENCSIDRFKIFTIYSETYAFTKICF